MSLSNAIEHILSWNKCQLINEHAFIKDTGWIQICMKSWTLIVSGLEQDTYIWLLVYDIDTTLPELPYMYASYTG